MTVYLMILDSILEPELGLGSALMYTCTRDVMWQQQQLANCRADVAQEADRTEGAAFVRRSRTSTAIPSCLLADSAHELEDPPCMRFFLLLACIRVCLIDWVSGNICDLTTNLPT
jgi:hypothetical protein